MPGRLASSTRSWPRKLRAWCTTPSLFRNTDWSDVRLLGPNLGPTRQAINRPVHQRPRTGSGDPETSG
eukprot:392241-Pyramimonas_sp.AAC.1